MNPRPKVRIIHETNPRKYFPAVFALQDRGLILIVGSHRYSVIKEWLRSGLKDRRPLVSSTREALSDLWFRLRIPFTSGETILFGWAPWDWRMLIYAPLVPRNRIIYHTSWPRWGHHETPRSYGPLNKPLRLLWLAILRHPHVRVVAVLETTQDSLRRHLAIESVRIPHAVPSVFFEAGKKSHSRAGNHLRLLYVGELSYKKGVETLIRLMERIADLPVQLTLVGDGILRHRCSVAAAKMATVSYLGVIDDRSELATTMAAHDILVAPSRRQNGWEELFGIVIAEALATGMGVIASDHLGPRSILGRAHPQSLIVDGDGVALERLIRRLATDQRTLEQFVAGHRGIADEYALDRVSSSWLGCLAYWGGE